MNKNYRAIGILVGLVMGLGWIAQAHARVSNNPDTGPYGGVPYVSGGIGLDERETLRAIGKKYNLHLNFALAQGNYVSDVEVQIADAAGQTVVEAISQGPWFLIKLPAGTYHIRAQMHGQSLEQVVQVSQLGQTERVFLWKG